jgi:hypothetical protein
MKTRVAIGWLVVIVALAALGWWARRPSEPNLSARVVLLTPGWRQAPPPGLPVYRLPDAMAHPGAQAVPDVATLRRLLPTLRAVEIRGVGVDPVDVAELRGVQVTWPDSGVETAGVEIVAVACPREITLGQPVRVSGRLAGLAAGATVAVVLEEPDGHLCRVEVAADDRGAATFLVVGLPTRAEGRFLWRLRVGEGSAGSPLGVVVAAPHRPRVLLLQDAPAWEIARLHEWLVRGGHEAALRTRVSAERWRWVGSASTGPDSAELAPALLAGFDLIVTTEDALVALGGDELRALTAAVREEGLGVLVLGEPQAGRTPSTMLPWQLAEERNEPAEALRATRLRLASGQEWPEALNVWAVNWPERPLVRVLARDSQGRVVAAQEPLGQGWLGRSLVADSWRWPLAGRASDYAVLWSEVLGALARPKSLAGAWRLQGTTGMIEVGRAMDFRWSGAAGREPQVARVRGEGPATPIELQLAAWPRRSGEMWTRWWPSRMGWHRFETDEGGVEFYVGAPGDWPGIRRVQRGAATAALVMESVEAPAQSGSVSRGEQLRVWLWLAWFIFVAALGALWWRERSRV